MVAEAAFQSSPQKLSLPATLREHASLWSALDKINDAAERRELFSHHVANFRWFHLPMAERPPTIQDAKSGLGALLRGWGYDSDGGSGMILKAWAEHRFGLRSIHYGETRSQQIASVEAVIQQRFRINLSFLFEQLDLLYTFCQRELRNQGNDFVRLFRGTHDAANYAIKDVDRVLNRGEELVEFNCLSSFTDDVEIAWEFDPVYGRCRCHVIKSATTQASYPRRG